MRPYNDPKNPSAQMEPDEPTSTLLLEMVVLVAFFPAFLREYFRIALPPPALCCLLLALDLAVATLRRRNRLPNAMQAVPLAAICFLAVEVAATWHGDAFWPLSHKLAAYTAADLIFAAHQLSLYLAVWTAARLASRFLPSQKPRSARLAFLLCLGAYLTLDRDWFLVSMTHIGLGYVRLMATADGLRHMGMDAKSFRQVAVDLSAFAVAILAPSVIVRGRAA